MNKRQMKQELKALANIQDALCDDVERLHQHVDMWETTPLKERVIHLENSMSTVVDLLLNMVATGLDIQRAEDVVQDLAEQEDLDDPIIDFRCDETRGITEVHYDGEYVTTLPNDFLYEFHNWCNFNDLPLNVR